jgi:hypothetical protein
MRKIVFVCVTTLLLPFYSMAWGVLGHRIVGEIADHHLTAKARAEIKKILGNETLAMASNWGDFIKSDKSYDYINSWHYINLPSGLDSTQLYNKIKTDKTFNLYNRLEFLIKELKSKKLSKEKKIMYLKLLIHFIGDAHQPMHTARPEDRGGNDIKLYWFNTPTNLHRVWDEHLVEFQQLSYTEHTKAIDYTNVLQRKKWQAQPISYWIYESYQIAEKLYTEVKPEDKLSYQYNFQHVELMNQQLLKGGIRLAGVLNWIFG